MPYAHFKPATYDLRDITEIQMEALVQALALLIHSNRMDSPDIGSEEAEKRRLQHIGAIELLDATKPARRTAAGIEEED